MGTTVEFILGDLAFDPPAIEAMVAALDDVCDALNFHGSVSAREMVALRIIELARLGECGQTKLRDALLAEAKAGSRC